MNVRKSVRKARKSVRKTGKVSLKLQFVLEQLDVLSLMVGLKLRHWPNYYVLYFKLLYMTQHIRFRYLIW
jgi:hypothetical protein